MKTFTITLSYEVDARDEEEAVDIAAQVRQVVNDGIGHRYKILNAETQVIQEV
jgi:hypothetical protein